MSTKKEIKKAIAAVWDELKLVRSERRKLYAPEALLQSAEELAKKAAQLQDLARQLSALSAMPPPAEGAPARKKAAKRATTNEG